MPPMKHKERLRMTASLKSGVMVVRAEKPDRVIPPCQASTLLREPSTPKSRASPISGYRGLFWLGNPLVHAGTTVVLQRA